MSEETSRVALDRFHTVTAILRGLTTDEARPIGDELYAAGLRVLEIPLNSPDPFSSIQLLREHLPQDCLVGAGTVLTGADAQRCRDVGAQFVVSPNTDLNVITTTGQAGLVSIPGAATPTEALAALHAGAHLIKVFPAVGVGLDGFRCWQAVLPRDLGLIPVGGVELGTIGDWVRAGAVGVGLGTALYRPGAEPADVGLRAAQVMQAWGRAVRAHRAPR